MDKQQLYDSMASRKHTPVHLQPYAGGNGRVDRCVELFRKGVLKTGGALLDVGGSIGDLGYALKDDFAHRVVLDISSRVLEAARSKDNFSLLCDVDKGGFCGIASKENLNDILVGKDNPAIKFWTHDGPNPHYKLGDGIFNVVTALDFIEHIVDPGGFARECFRVLVSGGQVFINTPNIQFWKHQETLAVHGRFPHTSGDQEVYHGGHLAFYTFLDLCEIFSAAGFSKFEQINDQEGYAPPPQLYIDLYKRGSRVNSREENIQMAMSLGCPNLLFKCEKP